jgi:DNA-binding response OmpR family regulator
MAIQQPCVLIVEDEADLRQLIVEALSHEGFAPSEAATV